MIAAVLFDMDGTLVDSEPLWQAVEGEVVAGWGLRPWDPALWPTLTGGSLRATARAMIRHAGADLGEDEVVGQLLCGMAEKYRRVGVPWVPGALDLLDALSAAGIGRALVSSSYRILLDAVLAGANPGLFGVSIGGDEVDHPKPAPDPYLQAATALGVSIGDCVVVEDSAPGVRAGLASGAITVAVGPASVGVEGAHARVDTLAQLSVDTLRRLTRESGGCGCAMPVR